MFDPKYERYICLRGDAGYGDCCKVAKDIDGSSGVVWIVVHESELEDRPMFESMLDELVVFVVSVVV